MPSRNVGRWRHISTGTVLDGTPLKLFGIIRKAALCLNAYVPRLQREQGIVWFFREHRGQPLPSAALMRPMSRSFVAALEGFTAQHNVPLVQFHKGQRKDDVMAEHLRRFAHDEGVVFIGKGQEKTSVFRTEKRRNPCGQNTETAARTGIYPTPAWPYWLSSVTF